jgi:hypothetical protein
MSNLNDFFRIFPTIHDPGIAGSCAADVRQISHPRPVTAKNHPLVPKNIERWAEPAVAPSGDKEFRPLTSQQPDASSKIREVILVGGDQNRSRLICRG